MRSNCLAWVRLTCLRSFLLRHQELVYVQQLASLRQLNAIKHFVDFFIAADGVVQVSWFDDYFLLIDCEIARSFQYFLGNVVKDSRQEYSSRVADPLAVPSPLDHGVDPTDREDSACSETAADPLFLIRIPSARFPSFLFWSHFLIK